MTEGELKKRINELKELDYQGSTWLVPVGFLEEWLDEARKDIFAEITVFDVSSGLGRPHSKEYHIKNEQALITKLLKYFGKETKKNE